MTAAFDHLDSSEFIDLLSEQERRDLRTAALRLVAGRARAGEVTDDGLSRKRRLSCTAVGHGPADLAEHADGYLRSA